MADKLSLPNLLALLDVDQYNDDSDRQIKDLCEKAEGLRRCRRYEDAISTAQKALLVAKEKPCSSLHGMALLFLGLARHSCNSLDQNRQAIHNCEEAITNLSNTSLGRPHNYAVAEVFRAQLELGVHGDNPASIDNALAHLQRAVEQLQEFVEDYRASQESKQRELAFIELLRARISRLSTLLNEVSPIHASSPNQSTNNPSGATLASQNAPPVDLPVPTQLVWPASDTIELMPVYGGFGPNQNALNYIEVNGKPYAIHPIDPTSSNRDVLELCQDQSYIVFQINGNGGRKHHDERYVLMRPQDRPDQAGQRVVVIDPPHRRVWVWTATDDPELIAPRIIGGTNDTGVGARDERQWDIRDGSEAVRYCGEELRMIGVVEAILTPLTSLEPFSPSASTPPPEANCGSGLSGKEPSPM